MSAVRPWAAWLAWLAPALAACGPTSTPTGAPPAERTASGDEALDLDITFVPDISGNDGWFERDADDAGPSMTGPRPLRLRSSDLGHTPDARRLMALLLERAPLAHTSLVLDAASACAPELRAAAAQQRPARMLIALDDALTPEVVRCLAALPTPRLYLTGCLYRAYRHEACDGDADLAALTTSPDATLAARIAGLALSIRKPATLAALSHLPRLAYLALATGEGTTAEALFEALPFDGLPALASLHLPLILEGEGDVMAPGALRLIAQLRVLRWNGGLALPLPTPCRLERVFNMRLSDDDAAARALPRLRVLETLDAGFTSAEPVTHWPALTTLTTRHWPATDLAPLATLTQLRHLGLGASAATDFGVLARLPQLRTLDLSQTALTSLDVLADLRALETLDVGFTAVRDLAPLAKLTALADLDLHATKVDDVTVLASLRALRKLSLSQTAVRDLTPLTGLPRLAWLILYDSQVTDLGVLASLPALERANIGGLRVPPAQVEALRQRLPSGVDGSPRSP
ncbi:MAG: hypothetical protein U1F43_35540 [Myxococcota bacterium]